MKGPALGLAALAPALVFAMAISAAAGDLDPTFAGDGTVITDFESGSYDLGLGVAVQRDRKIVVAGLTQSSTDNAFALVRYGVDGTLDATFDGDGKVRTDFTPSSYEFAEAVALQSDGKIVAAGIVTIPGSGTGDDFGLARYNADGTLDSSFDADGKVVTNFAAGGLIDGASAVAVQSDGKIVAAGITDISGFGDYDFAVARYNSDGSLDTSFEGDGRVVTPISGGSERPADIVVQADGKLVVGGEVGSGGGAMLVRYTADGSLDSSFDGDGKVFLTTPTSGVFRLALQSDGKIVTAGSRGIFSVTRLNPNGSVDTSFGEGGNATAPFQASAISRALAIQPDGKVVAGGIGAAGHNFAVARFQQRGTLDQSFGSDGMVESVLGGPGGRDVAYDLGLAPDGKIVLAGASRPTSSGPYDFAVARYIGLVYCIVPRLKGATVAAARRRLTRARCKLGRVRRAKSRKVKKGRVIKQTPRPGARLAEGGKVNVVVSRGRK